MIRLYIEEHIEEEEPNDIGYKLLTAYCDEETNVLIRRMKINANLEIGKLYDFDYVDDWDEDSTLYIYKPLKRLEDGSYLLCEEYGGKIYAISSKRLLGDGWVICNIKNELRLDLSEWM